MSTQQSGRQATALPQLIVNLMPVFSSLHSIAFLASPSAQPKHPLSWRDASCREYRGQTAEMTNEDVTLVSYVRR